MTGSNTPGKRLAFPPPYLSWIYLFLLQFHICFYEVQEDFLSDLRNDPGKICSGLVCRHCRVAAATHCRIKTVPYVWSHMTILKSCNVNQNLLNCFFVEYMDFSFKPSMVFHSN